MEHEKKSGGVFKNPLLKNCGVNAGICAWRMKTIKGLCLNMCYHIIQIGDEMSNMTLSVPEELHRRMKEHTELKWSDIARRAFERKLKEVEMAEKLLRTSELTEEDAEKIGHKIKGSIRRRLSK
ncbi:MAG: hypothetical protein HY365_02170 [Candidatus Aenigmarchaeota archaeon]|nr:hypothetical protein [Candidatus Aenigmarchaeota archaeon]